MGVFGADGVGGALRVLLTWKQVIATPPRFWNVTYVGVFYACPSRGIPGSLAKDTPFAIVHINDAMLAKKPTGAGLRVWRA